VQVVVPPLLALILIVLKAEDIISLSWKRVLAPMWFWLIVATIAAFAACCGIAYQKLCLPVIERRERATAERIGYTAFTDPIASVSSI
jgi:hypothetical protein